MLAKTAGVKHLVVLINKMDDPTVNWDEERFVTYLEHLTKFLYLLHIVYPIDTMNAKKSCFRT